MTYVHAIYKQFSYSMALHQCRIITSELYLLIDLNGENVPLPLVANQRRQFREIRHCDWLRRKWDISAVEGDW